MSDINHNDPGFDLYFLPYLRLGFVDDQLQVEFGIKNKNDLEVYSNIRPKQSPSLIGPNKILGIDSNMIARVIPPDRSNDGESNYFSYMDFVDIDFIWRYTPISNISDISNRLDPWICLIILDDTEINEMTQKGIDVFSKIEGHEMLTIYTRFLPDPASLWATAHVQLNGLPVTSESTGNDIKTFLKAYPERCNSRLMALRRLEPQKSFHAFLINVHKIALVPYGLAQETIPKTEKAWTLNDITEVSHERYEEIVTLRVYHRFSFQTAEEGDFESLLKKLLPWKVDPTEIGTRMVDSTVEGDIHFFKGEGALAAPGFYDGADLLHRRLSYADAFSSGNAHPKTTDLFNSMNESLKNKQRTITNLPVSIHIENQDDEPDPLVTYPVYGRYFRHVDQIESPSSHQTLDPDTEDAIVDPVTNEPILIDDWSSSIPWIHELNLDFRYRMAAGYGTTVIQNQQDDYLEKCWSQVGDLLVANEKLRRTKVGFGASEKLFKKHFDIESGKLTPEHFAFLSTPFHSHFALNHCNQQISSQVGFNTSGLSPGIFTPSFRRIAFQRVGAGNMYNPDQLWAPWIQAQYLENSLKHRSDFIDCTVLSNFLLQQKLTIGLFIDDIDEKLLSVDHERGGTPSNTIPIGGYLTGPNGIGIPDIKLKLFSVYYRDFGGPEINPLPGLISVDATSGGFRIDLDKNFYKNYLRNHDSASLSDNKLIRIYLEFYKIEGQPRLDPRSVVRTPPFFNTKGCLEILWDRFSVRILNLLQQPPEQASDSRWWEDLITNLNNLDIDLSVIDSNTVNAILVTPSPPKPEVIPVCPIDIVNDLFPSFKPANLKTILKNKLSQVIKFGNTDQEVDDSFDPILVSPKINEPLCVPLKRISLETILPGAGNLENNVVFLMEENRPFVEGFINAANAEMGSELVFNEFFTDQRGTIFRYFWESTTLEDGIDPITGALEEVPPSDIDDIHTWDNELGKNKTKNMMGQDLTKDRDTSLVLVIKGDVIRRYPDILAYALKCDDFLTQDNVNNFSESDDSVIQEMIDPIFRTRLGPDIVCIGFPIVRTQLKKTPEHDFEYYFVLQQPLELPNFGADVIDPDIDDDCDILLGSSTTIGPDSKQLKYDLSWSHLIKSGCLASNNYIDNFCPACFSFDQTSDPTSASIAAVTYQLPMRVVYHASSLIDLKH